MRNTNQMRSTTRDKAARAFVGTAFAAVLALGWATPVRAAAFTWTAGGAAGV